MSYYVFDIEWEGGGDHPQEWTVLGVICPEDIEDHLTDTFSCKPVTFEYTEL